MKILSHRGYWRNPSEKNTECAFRRSFEAGFGAETDVRDCARKLVIAHDMPNGTELSLTEFLALLPNLDLPLAINIKADGLALDLKQIMAQQRITNWFVFDMSIPDTRAHLRAGNPVFVRISDVEKKPPWLSEAKGVWLDAFEYDWFDVNLVEQLLRRGKQVCIVSPELHGRDYRALWQTLSAFAQNDKVLLCTDHPIVAQLYFQVSNR